MSWYLTVLPQFKLHMNRSSFHIYLMHEINTNEHQNIFYLNRGKTSMHNCKKSTTVNIFFDLICLSDKMADSSLWLVRSSVSQALCEWSITKCWVQVGAILLPDGAYPLKSPPPPFFAPFVSETRRVSFTGTLFMMLTTPPKIAQQQTDTRPWQIHMGTAGTPGAMHH